MKRLIYLALAALLLICHSGCGSSDEFNINSFSNNQATGNGLSGQTGTVVLQTQLAAANQTLEDLNIVQGPTIPASVDTLRFTGFSQSGLLIYGPVEVDKAAEITLEGVPVEVSVLRVELLVNGFTIGGLATGVNLQTGETVFLSNPTYVFLGSGVVDPGSTVYGSFITNGQGDFPNDGEFTAAEAPVVDFPFPQVTNGVSRNDTTLNYTVTADGEYLLTYSVELAGDHETVLTCLIRNDQYVPGTDVDIADLENAEDEPDLTGIQSFQTIVSLQAGDQFRLGVKEFVYGGEGGPQQGDQVVNQVTPEQFEILSGTFTVVRLGAAD